LNTRPILLRLVIFALQPAVSVGNVGQLACDVLISSLNARRIGFLCDDSTVPVVGSEPFVPLDTDQQCHHVTTAVEGMVCHSAVSVFARSLNNTNVLSVPLHTNSCHHFFH